MSLRTRLLLSFIVIAIVPLALFGLTSYQAATTSLNAVERDNLSGALDSVNRAFDDIQKTLSRTVQDNSNWDDLHDQVAKDPTDADWMKTNFSPDVPTSTVNTFNLNVFSVWRGSDKSLFSVGPADQVSQKLGDKLPNILSANKPQALFLTVDKDIYLTSFASIRTSKGEDPNGVILMGRVLGKDDLAQIKALTGYDVALYQGQNQVAIAATETVTPGPTDLQVAATGKQVFNQSDPTVALAYQPIKDDAGNTLATVVVWRPRQAVTAGQTSIAGTLAVSFAVAAALAVIVSILLGRSIAQPLLAMADRAAKMSAGDLSQRMVAPWRAKDEVGRLAEAFNEMADKVGTRVTTSESENVRLQAMDEFRLNLLTAITQALRGPLSSIKTHSEELDMALYGSLTEPQRRSTSVIRRAAAVQEALLADLMDFARAQQHQLQISRARLRLQTAVRDVLTTVQPRYADRNVELTVRVPEDLPPLFADNTRVEQILETLLGWAYDYSLPGGQIILSAVPERGVMAISVSDTSGGLSVEDQQHVFDLFYHPSRNGKEAVTSNGLGLALIKVLIEQQGGSIRLEVLPGRGNVFTFTLPTTN